MLLLAGLVAWFGASGELFAQSKMKRGGPVVDLDGMKSQVFEVWKQQKAQSPELYKFLLPKDLKSDQDAAEMIIAETSLKAEDVIAGWKNNWAPRKPIKDIETVTRTEKFKVGNAEVTKVTTQGDYTKDGKKMEDFRFQGYIFETKNKKYTIQFTGPFKTVGLHFVNFDPWIKDFK
jgi:hypothetical protein